MAIAAACYAAPPGHEFRENTGTYFTQSPDCWPWTPDWWKGATQVNEHRRDLVKAGALILAEIERLDRVGAASRVPSESPPAQHDKNF